MKDLIRATLDRYEPQLLEADEPGTRAAVLLLLYNHNQVDHLVFQKRTETVQDHKGQISFPGGAADPEDTDLMATALRETFEEIGVQPSDVDVLGRLDEMRTVSNYRVSPYVGWLDRYPYPWRFSSHEVAYLLEVPLPYLLDPATLIPDRRTVNGRQHVFPSYRFGNDLIWGATARMLTNFLDICATVPGLAPA